ncbi:DUF6705 family protein [Chryseobacterium echinoideorum]|uniref:DUF6705 family protein n=1 Tax=Chryseobacterium echinoideorum TaxID=1549648 RepID=UPI001185C28F|nr:DUF6705 family protein [Chryseobacterium echinoideorum]
MKNKISLLIAILGLILSCKSQTLSLDVLSQCENKPDCPDYVYLKDTNNRLNKFVGIWKGIYTDGRTYEFHFTKKENYGGWFNEKFKDIIIARVLIKNSNGSVLENTLTTTDQDAMFSGFIFDKTLNSYQMYYSGNAECNDKGHVYLSFPNPNNLSQMKLVFIQDIDFIVSCPSNYKTVMPDAKPIMLTKQ